MSVKISELPILDSLADNDVIAGVDTSANVTSKIEMATLKNYIDTNTQYTAGTNIDITNNVVSAPNVYNKNETDELLEEKDEQIEELQSEVDSLSTIFNAFPTESGEGESLTLDDTAEVKFKKFDLKGNTSQTTYSGKNLFDKDNYINDSWASTRNGWVLNLEPGTYTLSANVKLRMIKGSEHNSTGWGNVKFGAGNANANTFTFSISENFNQYLWMSYTDSSDNEVSITKDNISSLNVMLEKGSSATEFEPFVGGTASPNPSYPQPVNVVSGDNEIQINNLIDISKFYVRTDNNARATNQNNRIELLSNTSYTIIANNDFNYGYFELDSNLNVLTDSGWKNGTTNFITNSNTKYIWFNLRYSNNSAITDINNFMKNINIKLFKENEYEEFLINLPVENLWNEATQTFANHSRFNNPTKDSNNVWTFTISGTDGYAYASSTISLGVGTYTVSAIVNNGDFLLQKDGTTINNTFTLTETSTITFRVYKNGVVGDVVKLSNVMLEKGSKANSYTPYGTTPIELCKIRNYQDYFYKDSGKWYLHKEIGSKDLTSTSVNMFELVDQTTYKRLGISKVSIGLPSGWIGGLAICTHFKEKYTMSIGMFSTGGNGNNAWFGLPTTITTLNEAKTYMDSLTGSKIYYVLATPTNTEITYQPLIDQLNLLEKAMSKDSQTNISQVSNDKPFILDVTAIKSLQNVLDRIELLES